MNLTEREKVLMLVFPAILIVTGYVLFGGVSAHQAMTHALSTLDEQRQLGDSPTVSRAKATRQRVLRDRADKETELLRIEEAELVQRANELCGQVTLDRKDLSTVSRMTALFRGHDLVLAEEGVSGVRDAAGMATSLETAIRQLRESLEPEGVKTKAKGKTATFAAARAVARPVGRRELGNMRQFRFCGCYVDMMRALEELASGDYQAIPVCLTMEEIGIRGMYSAAYRTWTILVRI